MKLQGAPCRASVMAARIRKIVARPRFVLDNLRLHFNLEPSAEDHIFVLGPPRSGTTLVMKILNSHSNIRSLPVETFFFLRWNLLENERTTILPPAQCKMDGRTSISRFDALAKQVKDDTGARRFLEKTPEHALRLTFLLRYYPNGKFIFVVRDGRDGFLSAQRNPLVKERSLDQYARLWKRCVAIRLREKRASNVLTVKYEELCVQPEEIIKRAMDFVGESFEVQQISPFLPAWTGFEGMVGHERLREPITPHTVGGWRSQLSPREIKRFNAIAGRELKNMGYEL